MLKCIVVTPERTVLEKPADFVVVTLYDGELGIAPRHRPFIGRLGYGETRISQADEAERYYVEGGFVEVFEDMVTIITNRALPTSELDEAVALEQLHAAQLKPATSPELMAIRDRAVMQSRAQLHTARRAR